MLFVYIFLQSKKHFHDNFYLPELFPIFILVLSIPSIQFLNFYILESGLPSLKIKVNEIMKIPLILKKTTDSARQLSMETTLSIVTSLIGIFIASYLTPYLLRWMLLPKVVTSTHHLDFTFNTCVDQLHGACSFPEAIVNLEQVLY